MAKFEIAEKITGVNEGLYANNKADTGGETWAGISRNNFPTWSGWKIIDEIKVKHGKTAAIINKYGRLNPELKAKETAFWKSNFWDVNKLDQFKDQQVANTVYDFGVNSGVGRAAKYLQEVIGVTVDGKIGSITLGKLNSSDPKEVHKAYNAKREVAYRSWAKGNQAQFLKSWLSRLKPYSV